MDAFKEPIYYQNPALCLKVWQFALDQTPSGEKNPWHYHKEVEFILVKQGIHSLQTANHSYTLHPGDIVMIGSNQLHRGFFPADVVFIVLHLDLQPYFDPAMMSYYRNFVESLYPLEELNYIFESNKDARKIVGEIITAIHHEVMEQRKGYEIAVSMHIKHLLLTLFRYDSREQLQAFEYFEADVLRPVIAYVDEQLSGKIELEQASRIAGMNYSYFSTFFKKKLGISFIDYVNRKRVLKAEQLLATASMSVTEIAEAVGFSNMAHFYTLFKRHNGCTPKQFLSKMLDAPIET
ncbi:AraC family transcriptional regulator [Paenibacillaceae bacterium]|nr:AraC family transcriptional regulator [Paenibacillaceae bacterium]